MYCNASSELHLHALLPITRTIQSLLLNSCFVLCCLCSGTKCYIQTFSGEMQPSCTHTRHTSTHSRKGSQGNNYINVQFGDPVHSVVIVGVTKRNTGERLLKRISNNSKAIASPNNSSQHGWWLWKTATVELSGQLARIPPSTSKSFCSLAVRASTPSNCSFWFIPLVGTLKNLLSFCLKARVTFCDHLFTSWSLWASLSSWRKYFNLEGML